MAANCARRTLQFSSASAKTILSRPPSSPFASNASKLTEFTSLKPASAPRLAAQKLKFSRLPVELGGAQSLIPLHSATASALFTSLLSLHNTSWGCLSEGKGIFTAEEGVRYEISLITCFSSELSWTCGLLMFDAAPSF
ncbi:hypothetical protein ACFX2I_011497 [Malus domestica]